jgi:hypothetical protein
MIHIYIIARRHMHVTDHTSDPDESACGTGVDAAHAAAAAPCVYCSIPVASCKDLSSIFTR